MSQQHSCCGMCKILTWSGHHFSHKNIVYFVKVWDMSSWNVCEMNPSNQCHMVLIDQELLWSRTCCCGHFSKFQFIMVGGNILMYNWSVVYNFYSHYEVFKKRPWYCCWGTTSCGTVYATMTGVDFITLGSIHCVVISGYLINHIEWCPEISKNVFGIFW